MSDTQATITGLSQSKLAAQSTMKAAVLHKLGKPLSIETLEVPKPAHGQVLVKLAYSGVCHTQVLEVRGKRGEDKFLPHTLGHEGSGVVAVVGPGVNKVKPGNNVIVSWMKGEGANANPCSYRMGDLKINAGPVTTFNEYTVIPENRVTPISKRMPLDVACLVGCAVSTGAGAVINTANVQSGNSVVIFGLGGVGLSAIQAAHMRQASMVIAVDIVSSKLDKAREFGATHALDAFKCNVVEEIKKLTEGRGVDFAIEAAGKCQTMEQAFESIRRGGGLAVLIGNLPFKEKISIDPFELICGKSIVGSWGGSTVPDRDFPQYIDWFLSGKLPIDKLITHTYKLDEINEALKRLEEGEAGRILIDFQASNS